MLKAELHDYISLQIREGANIVFADQGFNNDWQETAKFTVKRRGAFLDNLKNYSLTVKAEGRHDNFFLDSEEARINMKIDFESWDYGWLGEEADQKGFTQGKYS